RCRQKGCRLAGPPPIDLISFKRQDLEVRVCRTDTFSKGEELAARMPRGRGLKRRRVVGEALNLAGSIRPLPEQIAPRLVTGRSKGNAFSVRRPDRSEIVSGIKRQT